MASIEESVCPSSDSCSSALVSTDISVASTCIHVYSSGDARDSVESPETLLAVSDPSDDSTADRDDFESDRSVTPPPPAVAGMTVQQENGVEGDVKRFSKEQSLIILDWDDTVLPTSWLAEQNLYAWLNDEHAAANPMPEQAKQLLDQVCDSGLAFLEAVTSVATVVIITNADDGWISLSCQKFLPSMYQWMLKNPIRMLSARSTWEPTGLTSPFEWKARAFEAEIHAILNPERPADPQPAMPLQMSSGKDEALKRNLISIGDSNHERGAVLKVSSEFPLDHVCKSVKFVERPDPEQLSKEHDLIVSCLDQLFHHDAHLDMCVKWDN